MKLVVQALKKQQIIALEAVTGFGKSLCMISTVYSFIQQCKIIKNLLLHDQKLTEDQQYFYNTTKYFKSMDYKSINYPRMIFTSKTHSQLNQFKDVLEDLASRKHYCLNTEIRNFTENQINVNTACKIIKKQNRCSYFNQTKLESLQDVYLAQSQAQKNSSMKFFMDFCRKNEICPFYLSKEISNKCDVVLSPYQYILQAAQCIDIEDCVQDNQKSQNTQNPQNEIFTNNILIFDEAHNLPTAACESFNVDITFQSLGECLNDIQYMIELYAREQQLLKLGQKIKQLNIEDNIGSIQKIIKLKEITQQIIQYFHDKIIKNQEKLQQDGQYIDFYVPKEFPKITSDIINICDNMDYFINSTQIRQEKKHQCYLSLLTQVFTVIQAVQIQQIYKKHFKMVIQQTNQLDQTLTDHKQTPKQYKQIQKNFSSLQLSDQYIIQIITLSPKYLMDKLCNTILKPSSIILTSGTLSPLQDLNDEFYLKFDLVKSLPSIFNDNSLKSFIIEKNNYESINGSYNTRNTKEYQNSVIETIIQSTKLINYGGILTFFTSYSILNQFYKLLIQDERSRNLQIFIEYQDQQIFKDQLDHFYDQYKQKPTLFLVVYGGKLSEGIDFSNDMCRIVINVSIPFAPINSVYTQLKKQFLEEQQGGIQKYRLWYNTAAFRIVNQSCGRCIRHAKDFGMIILLDCRFTRSDYMNMLSKWIYNQTEIKKLQDLSGIQWLKEKQKQFQIQQEQEQKKQIINEEKDKQYFEQYNIQNQIQYNQVLNSTQTLQLNQIAENQNQKIFHQSQQNQQQIFKKQIRQYQYLQSLSQMDKVKKICSLTKQFQLISDKQIQIQFNNFVTNKRSEWKGDLNISIQKCEQNCQDFFQQNKYTNQQKIIALDLCILKVMLMN